MKGIGLGVTHVSDVAPLAGMNKLELFWLDDTQVTDLTPLVGMNKLKYLNLRGTQVSDLTPLIGLENVLITLGKSQKVTVPKELEKRVRWE